MYSNILAALDGTHCSNLAAEAAASLASMQPGSKVVGCHVYSSGLNQSRFSDMEDGLSES